MCNKSPLLMIIGLIMISLASFGQSISNDLATTMSQIRQGKYFNGTTPFLKYISTSPTLLIKEAEPYLSDTLGTVRSLTYELIYAAGKKNTDSNIRQQVVLDLLRGYNDKTPGIPDVTSKYLKQYMRDDFNNIAKDSIRAIVRRGNKYLEHLLLVVGYINIPDTKSDIQNIIANPQQNDKTKWAAHLALSRMGDDSETSYCIHIMQSRKMNNAIVYNMTPGLIYTHQKAAYDYLVTLLNSNEKNCISPNPDSGGNILCAYRVMEFLAPVIIDFPLETIRGVNQIKTKNYDEALTTARAWFKANMSDYKIKDEVL